MGQKSELQKMAAGERYRGGDPEVVESCRQAGLWMMRFNAMMGATSAERRVVLAERLASVGDDVVVRPPFYVDHGSFITLEEGVFINLGCTILDVCPVSIGAYTRIGPGVQILTPEHPRDPVERRQDIEYGRPVSIGANVWLGGGAIVVPGVTIGDDAIIGAGAVVTRDVPAGATMVGSPARPR